MQRAKLPGTDLDLSRVCLGTPEYGSSIETESAFKLMDTYLELGGNFLDTAHIYADWQCDILGMSEITIGKWVASRKCRDAVVVATKGGSYTATDPRPRLSTQQLTEDLEKGLDRLKLDCVDIYWLHRDDPTRPVEEILYTAELLKSKQYLRYYAASNWTWQRLEEARICSQLNGYTGFVASQIQWSLADVVPEAIVDKTQAQMDSDTYRYHADTGLAQVPYTSQAAGFFSGKYSRSNQSVGRQDVYNAYGTETNWARLDRACELATDLGCTTNQIALAYLINQPFAVYPIVGCRNMDQLMDSCKAADLFLTAEQVAFLRG